MHIAIIMDGNGRWAIRQGLPRHEGHRAGAARVHEITEHCAKNGIEQLTLYCLSSENWKRPKNELDFLLQMLKHYLNEERPTLIKNNIQFSVIGRSDGIPDDTKLLINECTEITKSNTGLKLCLAINYGSRGEITDAVKKIIQEGIAADVVDENCIAQHLYTAGMNDPDLLIRTAGEMRLSNYLLWQLSYAEIWITETCWPDFDSKLLDKAIEDFKKRKRNFGGLS
ncbi:MAG: di-trans,poly-cis-decaprenylcistransferase [Planctomycetaceae bacterium]|jgi:undecaprenyl diphosphate synthase|nr:di-trans,poly-cis-decaprenylcistransferase [Planctomycetaceae bacterium]